MEAIFTNLNVDTTAFIWHSVNFLVLVAAMWWLFFRPFAGVIERRQQRIQASLARAEEIDRLDRLAEAKRQELIAQAHKEVAEIRRRGEDQVRRFVVRSRAQTNAEADRIRAQAAARHAAASTPRDPRNISVRRQAATPKSVRSNESEAT
jgi:F0F1-type ATP synthase membrane subunit b/b'